VVPEIQSPGFSTIAGTVVAKSQSVSIPNSWKFVMLPLPRTRFKLMTVKPLFAPPNSLSNRFTSASPLLPFSGPSPGPSVAVPTWPL